MKQFSIDGKTFTLPEILAANPAEEHHQITEALDRLAIGESWSPDLQSEEITRIEDAPQSEVDAHYAILTNFLDWLINNFGGMTEGMQANKGYHVAWIDGLDGLDLQVIRNGEALDGKGNTQAWNMLYALYLGTVRIPN